MENTNEIVQNICDNLENDYSTDIQKEYIEKIAQLSKKRIICRHKKRIFGYTAKVSIFLSVLLIMAQLIIRLIRGKDKSFLAYISMVSSIICIWMCFASESEMKKENKYIASISFLEGAIDSAEKE